ncbi:MAG: hypothetical protein PHW07_04320, partial [Sulfurospirillaceae bacterium]|nr:hypothetical protein [Sulfurospirillaceae bacterium]
LLTGASWALALAGAFYFFTLFFPFSFFYALLGAFVGSLLGIFFVVVFEVVQLQIEKLSELRKQTALMEKLLKIQQDNEKISNH